jgi:hypothetical protein
LRWMFARLLVITSSPFSNALHRQPAGELSWLLGAYTHLMTTILGIDRGLRPSDRRLAAASSRLLGGQVGLAAPGQLRPGYVRERPK